MKTVILHIILMLGLAISLCTGASAQYGELSVHEIAFLDLINEARENPLAMAASMGMNPEKILQDLPDLKDVLTQGLSPLVFNKSLYQAAGSHTEDMLSKGYYSHDSLDGSTYNDRIASAGYLAVETGESLGLLGFSNFIGPEESVRAVFEKMFRDELDASNTERRNILNPELGHAGIAIGTGTLNLGADIFNVYMVTCDFGATVEKAGIQLFQLINQARTRPLEVIESLGMDPDQVLADLPELYDILTEGLPPLAFNLQLYSAAAGHVKDMLENDYYSHDSLDGRTSEDRINEAGYDLQHAGESMGLHCLGADPVDEKDNDMDRLVNLMFRKMIASELIPDAEERNILDPLMREAGISIIKGASSGLGGICGDNVLLMVSDFGMSHEDRTPRVEGVVFQDTDQDTLYSPGEGLGQFPLSIEYLGGPAGVEYKAWDGTISQFRFHTNEAGGFGFTAVPGEYRITVVADGYELTEYIEVADEGTSVLMFSIPLSPEELDP